MTERMPEPVVVEWDQPSKVCKGMTVGERITYHQRRRWEAGADWDWQYERDLLEDEVAEQHPEKKPGFPEPGSPEFLVQAAQMAEAMHGLYVALQDAGFDTQEAPGVEHDETGVKSGYRDSNPACLVPNQER